MAVPIPADFDPNTAGNMPEIEKQFAVVCIEHAETYWKLLQNIQPSKLRLTKDDDAVLDSLKRHFPSLLTPAPNPPSQSPYDVYPELAAVSEESMKSAEGKNAWRALIKEFSDEKMVKDHNFGTLVRKDCRGDYTEENSIFITRIQFYAIEIARNRLGLNELIWEKAQEEKATST